MKRASVALLIASLTALSACKSEKTGSASSSAAPNLTGSRNTSCLVGRWPNTSLPLSLKLSSEFNGDFQAGDYVAGLNPLEQMAKVWNTPVSPTLSLMTIPFPATSGTGYTATSSFRDSEIGIYKSHTWFANVSSSALAITQFYGTVVSSAGLGNYIQLSHADIIVNYRDYGSRMTMNNNPLIEFDIPTIILHEMGHLLGLCHESIESSVMQPYYITTQRSLQTYDRDLIQDLYIDSAISGLSAMTNSKNAVSTVKNSNLPNVGTEVSGVIELRADGECIHKVNGQEIFKHKVDLK